MTKMEWINKEAVLWIHSEQIKEHGGSPGLLNANHLDACLERPQTAYIYVPNTSVYALAAMYAQSFIESHPFHDGNKRTAFVVCMLFLKLNGNISIKAPKEETYNIFYALATKQSNTDFLAKWLESHIV